MKKPTYNVKAKVWLYSGAKAAWHFVTIPSEISQELKKQFGDLARGWGSLPVEIELGESNWKTSIFPDKKSGCYFLPLKAKVRKKEKITNGDEVKLILKIEFEELF